MAGTTASGGAVGVSSVSLIKQPFNLHMSGMVVKVPYRRSNAHIVSVPRDGIKQGSSQVSLEHAVRL